MKNKAALAFLMFFALLGVIPATAQNQEGSVAIAGNIRPDNEDATISNFTKCVAELKGSGTADKDAIKACTKMAKIASDTAKRIANEAADATKASRPMLLSPYGYRYGGGYYYGSGYRSYYRSYRSTPRRHSSKNRNHSRSSRRSR